LTGFESGGTVSTRDQLESYLKQIEKRLRAGVLLRGAAILISAALTATVVLVLITNGFAFSAASLTSARVVLFLALALALGFGLALPLYGLSRRRAAGRAEAAFPQFQQRLVTFAERSRCGREPFIELLAADTFELTRDARPQRLIPDGQLLVSLAASALSLGLLVWIIAAGPGYLGYGAARLWTGSPHGAATFYDVRVGPGDASVRRNAKQLITAQLIGLQTQNVRLYARYQSASKWAQVSMEPQPGASGFQFLFASLPESVEYYVEAGPLRSRHYKLRVIDLPSIKQIRVSYRFPTWTGLPPAVEEHGGDLRAVQGTEAALEVFTDRPMQGGVLVLDNDRDLALSGGQANRYRGDIRIEKDGAYHVAVLDQGQCVRLSDDFFIEARDARPPDVRITRPGGDYRSSPVEEVTVSVRAGGEYSLNSVDLHYSVNGGPPQTVRMLKHQGVKEATSSTTINLEDFKLVPGDVVSFYATAKDARFESRTDMFFIQAEPFEREYSQSQIAGGAGDAAAGEQFEISQREKEIIAATWKQQGEKNASTQKAAEAGKFLSGVQTKLREQALALAGRLRAHGLTVENEELNGFEENMKAAAEAMGPASEKLKQQKWNDALPREQKALQHLLQAEATFRRMEVAFANQGPGRGAAGSGRDLASLLDLELDTEKNQYETGQTGDSATQRAQKINEALRKLDELAHREQELAERQSRQNGQDFQQRWQQEMLRRDAEQLQQQLEQLAQSGRQRNGSESASGAGTGGSQLARDQRLERALSRLRQAGEDMRRAASPGQSEADARRAADRLRDAQDLLGGPRPQAGSERLDSLAREGRRLAGEQREQAGRMRQALGQKGEAGSSGEVQSAARSEGQRKLADDRQRLASDLSRLAREMGTAERELESTQRPAARKLGEALDDMKDSELQSRVERSAESIRQGKEASSDSEPAIAEGMERLNQQLRQAQQALNDRQQNLDAALGRLERLRGQMEALARNRGEGDGRSGQPGGQVPGVQRSQPGAVGPVPGGAPGIESQSSTPFAASPQLAFQQTLRELNELRRDVRDQPGPLAGVEGLLRELDHLGYRQYPGNPALVEQLRTQVLAGVDKIELQLRHELDNAHSGQVRNADSFRVPPGYQDSVAEYFRRLSKVN
jgi:hypothetical protein